MVNTTKQISARARARAASSHFYELERQREEVQGRYFDSMDAVDKIYTQRDRAIAAATERAELAAAIAREDADAAIRGLLQLNVSRQEIAQRLGCTLADVRRAIDAGGPLSEGTPSAAAAEHEGSEPADVPAPALQ
ncbi:MULTISPECIES: hypothetical protein [unclassified Microbacterium]|uniref:hypothetical protein n=1 Tax=unclassified Microbacterium TaxID=2609290 RepID=UPI003016F20B